MFPNLTKIATAVAATFLLSNSAGAFVIHDIKVEGIQRTEPGTVFSHLPFTTGDEYTPQMATRAIHALYRSDLFKDVSIIKQGDDVIVKVVERPAVASIETHGIKAFDKTAIEKSLRQVGLAEGRIFDQATLDRADQELRRQYLAKGYYGVQVKTTISPLERNRVRVNINVDEGRPAKIESVRFVGNHVFSSGDLEDEMQLHPSNFWSWYTKSDLYSREKLAADLETLRSYYLNRGYLDFRVDSVQVQISPDRDAVYLTINLFEGEKYKVSGTKLNGDMLGLEEDFKKMDDIKVGDTFNASAVDAVSKRITAKLSTLGYAFSSANPQPIVNKEAHTVEIVYTVDPGRRVYVRHVNVTGNNRTRDDVIRREVTQYEESWFDSDKVAASRDRIDRLGFFETVQMDPVPVEGTRDMVDLDVKVKERPTGQISLGAGYSSSDKIVLTAGFSQNNIMGTGNALSVNLNTSKSQRTYAVSVSEPYITTTGISRDWDAAIQKVNLDKTDNNTDVEYEKRTAGVSFGIPFTALDRVYLGGRVEQTRILKTGKVDQNGVNEYKTYVDKFGKKPLNFLATVGWGRDSRDNVLAPTRGTLQRLNGEISVPGSKIHYYKLTYQYQHYIPLTKKLTLSFGGEAGYGGVYGNTKMFPFFKNYFVGGIGSVRGFQSGKLGPRYPTNCQSNCSYFGSDRELFGNIELLTPLPGGDRTLRLFGFLDVGNGWGYQYDTTKADWVQEKVRLKDVRASTGIGIAWLSPLGPLKFSYAFPIRKKAGDELERFQFQIGTSF